MRVLIVDDDVAIRETLSVILRDDGYEVAEAADGVEALQQIRATTEPMVVLLDMWMPRMNGEATLMTILAQGQWWSRLSFIVMTANPQRMTSHAHDLIKRYDIPLLVKPFDIDLFSDLVSRRARRLGRPEMRRA